MTTMQKFHVAMRRIYFDAEYHVRQAVKFLTMPRHVCESCHMRTWRYDCRDGMYCERCMPF